MLAEYCFIYKTDPSAALATPASRFFQMLDAGRDLYRSEKFSMLAYLCDVAMVPSATKESREKLREAFTKTAFGEATGPKRVFNADDPIAAQVFKSIVARAYGR